MSDGDRNEILANFQAASGLDDIGIAIAILEQESWDLQKALQSYLDGSSGPGAGANASLDEPPRVPLCQPIMPLVEDNEEQQPTRAPAASSSRGGGSGTNRRRPELPVLSGASRGSQQQAGRPGGVSRTSQRQPQPPPRTRSRPEGSSGGSSGVHTRSGASSSTSGASSRVVGISGVGIGGGASRSSREAPSKERLLLFRVRLDDDLLGGSTQDGNHRQQQSVLNVIVSENKTVAEIKRQLHQMMDHPVDIADMRLRGFPRSVSDSTVLQRLQLPKETDLSLASANLDAAIGTQRLPSAAYLLMVLNADRGCSQEFNYDADDCVGRLRNDVYSLWGIPTAGQVWSGWPLNNWSATFALSGLPTHQDLTVRRKAPSTTSTASPAAAAAPEDLADYDFDYENADDRHDDIDMDDTPGSGQGSVPLIRAGCGSDAEGAGQFVENFTTRYGATCPAFSSGSLVAAVRDADGNSTPERRPLALYLHHDRSIAAHIFCSNVLTNPAVVDFLNANFVIWPWDLTQPDNAAALVNISARQLGLDVADRVRQTAPEELPALLVLAHRPRAPHEIVGDVQSVSDPSTALAMLVKSADDFRAWLEAELAEESAREQRTMERLEMESAYEESLRLDRQKEQQREAQLRQERDERARVQEAQARALAQVPDEPTNGQSAATIRFRMPGGAETRQRRFSPSDRLRHLAAYCASLGYPAAEFALVTAFPRRALSQLDQDTTLEAAGLVPQETVLLEEK